jgi:hypothetical protein
MTAGEAAAGGETVGLTNSTQGTIEQELDPTKQVEYGGPLGTGRE